MALSNAERQARWRERRADDWELFCKAAHRVLRSGDRKATIAMSRLVDRWPQIAPETKRELARARDADTALQMIRRAAVQ
jgi:hypothetical protein